MTFLGLLAKPLAKPSSKFGKETKFTLKVHVYRCKLSALRMFRILLIELLVKIDALFRK